MESKVFGKTVSNKEVHLFTLQNLNGMKVNITNYGGIITSVLIPSNDGTITDVVLGFDDFEDYLKKHPYFGSIIGRVSGRTSAGKFTLEGKEYSLAINNGPNHLHGGLTGFDKRVWQAKETEFNGLQALELIYESPDGEEGYPGNLKTTVTYALDDNNEFFIDYKAYTDKATPLCLTNHSYFNLKGTGGILDHEIYINANTITDTNDDLTLLDEHLELDNHPSDFRTPAQLGERINDLRLRHGSHYWLNHGNERQRIHASRVIEPQSGRQLDVYSDAPCMQFYTGKFLDDTLKSKDGKTYGPHSGLCLECQDYPNGANAMESNILKAGDIYTQTTSYKFSNF